MRTSTEILPAAGREKGSSPGGEDRRSAVLDLVREASEAIRESEARASELEAEMADMRQRYEAEMQQVSATLASLAERERDADARAEAAETRTREAEEWLTRFHEAIDDGFSPFLGGTARR